MDLRRQTETVIWSQERREYNLKCDTPRRHYKVILFNYLAIFFYCLKKNFEKRKVVESKLRKTGEDSYLQRSNYKLSVWTQKQLNSFWLMPNHRFNCQHRRPADRRKLPASGCHRLCFLESLFISCLPGIQQKRFSVNCYGQIFSELNHGKVSTVALQTPPESILVSLTKYCLYKPWYHRVGYIKQRHHHFHSFQSLSIVTHRSQSIGRKWLSVFSVWITGMRNYHYTHTRLDQWPE